MSVLDKNKQQTKYLTNKKEPVHDKDQRNHRRRYCR